MLELAFGCDRSFLGFGLEEILIEATVSGCLPLDFAESFGVELTFTYASSETRTRFLALTFALGMNFSCSGMGLVGVSEAFDTLAEREI